MRGLRLGYLDPACKQVMRYDVLQDGQKRPGEMHAILVAPTRSGKGRDVLAPALLEWEGSAVVIDIKGQLCSITAPQRARMGQRIIILNPFKIWPEYIGPDAEQFAKLRAEDRKRCLFNARFNPMSVLLPESESFGSDSDSLAEAIVWQDTGTESHWADSARQLVSGLIMHIAAAEKEIKFKNLNRVRGAVCNKPTLFRLAKEAVDGEDVFAADKLSRFAEDSKATDTREITSIISTAMTQSGFIGSRAIANSLTTSDFRFRDLRSQPTTVYIILPTRHLANCAKWFRLVIAAALNDLLIEEEKGLSVLCLLDEFAQLGSLKLIEDAMGLAAGYGVQMFCVLQDLNQLKKNYKENFETFLSNAGISMFFSPRDITTSEHVSKMCGTEWESMQSKSVSESPLVPQNPEQTLSVNTSQNWQQVNILEPHQVRQLQSNQFVMFAENLPGELVRGYRQPYWSMPEFAGKFGVDPYHVKRKI